MSNQKGVDTGTVEAKANSDFEIAISEIFAVMKELDKAVDILENTFSISLSPKRPMDEKEVEKSGDNCELTGIILSLKEKLVFNLDIIKSMIDRSCFK